MNTIHFQVSSTRDAQEAASQLVGNGIPFAVDPWPDDEWMFSVKGEHESIVRDRLGVEFTTRETYVNV